MESFDAPRTSAVLVSVTKALLPAILQARHGKTRLQIVGGGLDRFKQLKGKRVLICPNHPSWDDADMIFALSSLVGENFNYLTAWEVLHHHFGYRTWLQHMGCMSIIRGYPDRASYKALRDILIAGKNKVVIFPEGEISHDSANLLPLKPGMVQIAFSALQKMAISNCLEPIYLLPVGIQYKFSGDVRPALENIMNEIEKALYLGQHDDWPLHQRIAAASRAMIGRLEKEYRLCDNRELFLDERIDRLRSHILGSVAAALAIPLPSDLAHLELAHILQSELYGLMYGRIKQKLPTGKTAEHQPKKRLHKSQMRLLSRDLHLVVDLVAMHEDFTGVNSSPERLAEVIDLLEVVVLNRRSQKGSRAVTFHIGEAIDLSTYLQLYKRDKKEAEDTILSLYKEQMYQMIGVS